MSTDGKVTILFVDDEPNVLQGLQRMLRPERHVWNTIFADGSAEALRELASGSIDIIITDMRMPIMNGAQLLDEVRIRYPHVLRVALSGHTDRELILQAVRSTHQFLAKPCDPSAIKATITNSLLARDLIADEALRNLISQTQSVPSLPSANAAFVEALVWGEGGATRLGKVVASDMGMSAKCLQLVNSAFFGAPRGACAPEHAIHLLGVENLRALHESKEVFSVFPADRMSRLDIDDLWTHCMLTGLIAKRIAEAEGLPPAAVDATFVAGFLHDMGKLILAAQDPERYDAFPAWFGPYVRTMEQEAFGAGHDAVGAFLLSLWGFHADIIEAVAWHHQPSATTGSNSLPLLMVHVANHLAHQNGTETEPHTPPLDGAYLADRHAAGKFCAWRELSHEVVMNGVYR